MPYLLHDWMIGNEVVPANTWIPERNWDRWTERAEGIGVYLPWRERAPRDVHAVTTSAVDVPDYLQDRVVAALAADIVSAQRDALLYRNLIERLKNAPSDATADDVVDQMQTLGMASASWPEAVGGPPPHQSPRVWRKVLDWLLWLAGEVTRMLFDLVDKTRTLLSSIGVSAVAVGLSWSPEVSFEFPMPTITNGAMWARARQFLDGAVTELEEKVFG